MTPSRRSTRTTRSRPPGCWCAASSARWPRLDRDVKVRRLTGLLARKGYPAGVCFRVVREELDRLGDDTEDLHDGFE